MLPGWKITRSAAGALDLRFSDATRLTPVQNPWPLGSNSAPTVTAYLDRSAGHVNCESTFVMLPTIDGRPVINDCGPGDYCRQVEPEVIHNLATPSTATVTSTISVSLQVVAAGDPAQLVYTVTNAGTVDIPAGTRTVFTSQRDYESSDAPGLASLIPTATGLTTGSDPGWSYNWSESAATLSEALAAGSTSTLKLSLLAADQTVQYPLVLVNYFVNEPTNAAITIAQVTRPDVRVEHPWSSSDEGERRSSAGRDENAEPRRDPIM